jgi:hypothetical protein
MDRIQTYNVLIVFISVIIFWIRIRIWIVSNTDTDQIFDGYRIRIRYRTDINTNMDIFWILNKNIVYIIRKNCIVFYDKIINYKL